MWAGDLFQIKLVIGMYIIYITTEARKDNLTQLIMTPAESTLFFWIIVTFAGTLSSIALGYIMGYIDGRLWVEDELKDNPKNN